MDNHDRSERHDEKSEKPAAKAIDNKVLAAMLRESASIVERGEFEPILYTALQDFRVYYKVHYPVKKNKHRSRSRSLTRDKEKKSHNSPSVANGLSQEASGQAKPPVTNTFDDSVHADTADQPIVVEDTETTTPVTIDVESTIEKHVDRLGGSGNEVFEPEPKIEPHIPDIAGIVTAIPLANSIAGPPKPIEDHYSPGGTIQKASANALFGKLKFPKKIGVTLPNAAFVAASKKNAERAKGDLEAFNGPLAQQAESSRRRKTGMEDGVAVKWCEVHFAMNCACKERTTSTNNPTPEPLSHSQPGERAQITAGQRDEEIHDLTQTAQPSSTATGSTGSNTTPVARVTSAGDSSDASSSLAAPETAATVKDAHNNPFHNIQEGGGQTMTQQPVAPLKPDFQRPANANSTLIANGWIEQQRRSKMRFVWKDVLASLVQGRKPGEETTLWIQREIFNPVTQKKELEALHQIPVKLLESCAFLDYSTDNRFTLKLYNATEEFVFRCRTESAAANWVQVLKKHHQISRGGATFEEEKKGPEHSSSSSRMSVNELRAICHGAGINTSGMERAQLEAAAEEVRRRGTYFAPPPGAPRPIPIPPTTAPQQNPTPPVNAPHAPPEMSQAAGSAKLSVNELRAICHGAGINTVGMERSQLERAAEEVRKRGTYFPPPNTHAPPPPSGSAAPPQPTPPPAPAAGATGHAPPPAPAPPSQAPQANPTQDRLSIGELRAICHGAGINTVGMERQQLEKAAEEVRKRGTYFDRPSTTPSASTAHHPSSATSVPEDMQREAARRRDEEEQNRQKVEDEHRRRMAEQEHQRRVAEAEQHRRYAEQQAAWQKQQQEEEHRRRVAEQQAAEQRRRHEEAVRQQQQWQQQQWQKQQQWNQQYQQPPPPKQWPPNQAPPSQHPQWQQQQQQRPQQPNQQPQQQQQRPQTNQQQQQQQPHHSAASEKYAKMANQTDEEGQAMIARIKHEILIHWALQPPQLQMLRPIDVLVTTIHKVFPPALGVPAHDYFSKFKPVSVADVSDNGTPDEEGLKKAVRKIRFFLHPDKLPKDLNPEQAFMVKMLWDVTSDAWDEFEKRKADLDWIK